MNIQSNILQNLHLVGISHWNTPVEVRERFALSKEQMVKLFAAAKKAGINSIFSISTCNRTEVYAITENVETVFELLLNATHNSQLATHQLTEHRYIKKSSEAVEHLFRVAAGLDAQITGDAQIIGQIREFHQLALQHSALDAVLNRLIEQAIAAGKKVKSQAQFNTGAFSIAHAGVTAAVKNRGKKQFKALVIGLGKTGKLTVQSLLKVIAPGNITVINRTDTTAVEVAKEFCVNAAGYRTIKQQIEQADVIFAATSSSQPIITNELLKGIPIEQKLFIDLSLPRNIETGINATVIDIDKLTDSSNRQKQRYTKLAERLIDEGTKEYYEWLTRYELAQNVKSHIAESIFDNGLDDDETNAPSKFIDGITSRHLRHFQKGKQSRNLAA